LLLPLARLSLSKLRQSDCYLCAWATTHLGVRVDAVSAMDALLTNNQAGTSRED
jgi:hypothetical protein